MTTTRAPRAENPPSAAGPTNLDAVLAPAEHIEYFCLVCGKKTSDHDPEEYADCGEAFKRWLPALRGEGYTDAVGPVSSETGGE